jgi:hypothetical protein
MQGLAELNLYVSQGLSLLPAVQGKVKANPVPKHHTAISCFCEKSLQLNLLSY